MRVMIPRSTSSTATTVPTGRRSSCFGRPTDRGPRKPRRASSARFRSSSRRTRTSWRSTSMRARSRGRCHSARAVPRCASTRCCAGVVLPERLGTRGNSGPMVTRGGLVFVGGGAPYLYAFDKATGAEIWRGATPFRTNANPMTYRARSGRQYVVIATGAGSDAALVAFRATRVARPAHSHRGALLTGGGRHLHRGCGERHRGRRGGQGVGQPRHRGVPAANEDVPAAWPR